MSSGGIDPAIWHWLRSERRLGIPHWDVSEAVEEARGRAAEDGGPATAPAETGSRSVGPSSPGQPARRAETPDCTDPSGQPEAAVGHDSRRRLSPTRAARPLSEQQAALPILADDPTLPPICRQPLSPEQAQAELERLDRDFVQPCTRCELHRLGRSQTVFGVGHPRPRLVFVGEGPGAEEDRQGIPFVGRAGQLLTRMIEAMTLRRDDVYICNVVKCRPPVNRTPKPQEMDACSPYLFRQLAILRAEVIVALGTPAAQTLLATRTSVRKLRGQAHHFPPAPLAHLGLPPARLIATYHPAYLLRNPPAKTEAWEDLKLAMRHLGLEIPRRRQRR